MSHCRIEIEADRVELGELVRTAGGPVHQTVRLYQAGRCVCRMQVVFLEAELAQQAGMVRMVDGREAGERD